MIYHKIFTSHKRYNVYNPLDIDFALTTKPDSQLKYSYNISVKIFFGLH